MAEAKIHRYEAIIGNVIDLIGEENLQVGDRLPAERELAKRFGCNHLTLRKALGFMIDQQLIGRRQGSGTFLLAPVENLRMRKGEKIRFQSSNLLALLAPAHFDLFFSRLLEQLYQVALKHNVELALFSIAEFNDESLTLPARLKDQGCRAIIISEEVWNIQGPRMADFLKRCELPVAANEYHFELPAAEAPSRVPAPYSRREIGFVCRYLAALGYREVVYLTPVLARSVASEYKELEYRRSMKLLGRGEHVAVFPAEPSEIDRVVVGLKRLGPGTAVICYDDALALRLMAALYKRGFSLPGDLGIFGSNDTEGADLSEPRLSTIRFPYEFLAETLIARAFACMKGERYQHLPIPDPAPVIRESCGGRRILGSRFDETVADCIRQTVRDVR